jgi:hypothetical protein
VISSSSSDLLTHLHLLDDADEASFLPTLRQTAMVFPHRRRGRGTEGRETGAVVLSPPLFSSFLTKISPLRSFRRRAQAAAAAAAAERNRRASIGSFDLLEQDLRLHIFGFLGADDFAEVAMVSRAFRDDCRHESLPQERTAVVRIPPRCPRRDRLRRLGSRLIAMASATASAPDGRRKFEKFSRLRILDLHGPVERVVVVANWDPPGGATVPEITALEWQGEGQASSSPLAYESSRISTEDRLSWGLARMLPSLREVDFSRALDVHQKILSDLLRQCERLERVVWHRVGFTDLDASGLRECRNLRELYMDGACFYDRFNPPRLELFSYLSDRLERVSVKGACCEGMNRTRWTMGQEMLIEFREERAESPVVPERPHSRERCYAPAGASRGNVRLLAYS